ncbi:ISKra4 family transposase [Specibacter cremeus]|uniref:ISKra4 family transposase n=1 Tax=Specibacter cremeus TaxID=1629051 RepID=UPI000F7BB028|nr:ISKra4 family transposase [Specibacter cremeus]
MPEHATITEAFIASQTQFTALVDFAAGDTAAAMDHADLEEQLSSRGRELLRQLYQDHLDLRARRERRLTALTDAAGVTHHRVEAGHQRTLATVFGEVTVDRLAYRAPGQGNLHPADAALNLPAEKHSHGLRRLAATEAARGAFDEACSALTRTTGVVTGKRQVEALTVRAATDFAAFYATHRQPAPAAQSELLVLQVDGKGIVMRSEGLRPATAKAAGQASPKLPGRLSKGEKRYRKRMAEVGAVHDAVPVVRTIVDILPATDAERAAAADGPRATGKWLTASVTQDAASVIAAVFDEATRRDPDKARTWVALVDGANHQIERIRAEAATRDVTVHVLIDIIHVMEYLWKAAWCFHTEGDPAAQVWVHAKARQILAGKARTVATTIRRTASTRKLSATARKAADNAARYLTNKTPYLDYPQALAAGWPIATGVIEGACRHLVADRLDITGARWGLAGAESVLQLRALRSNGDFEEYWKFHQRQEHQRVHANRYAQDAIPQAA